MPPSIYSLSHELCGECACPKNSLYFGLIREISILLKTSIELDIPKPCINAPSFIEIEYTISIITNFQQQMNDILSVFIKAARNSNWFKITRNGHGYECFFDDKFA